MEREGGKEGGRGGIQGVKFGASVIKSQIYNQNMNITSNRLGILPCVETFNLLA